MAIYLMIHEKRRKKGTTHYVVKSHCTVNGWSWKEKDFVTAKEAREYCESTTH